MYKKSYLITDKIIEIDSIYKTFHILSKEYFCDSNKIDISIKTSINEINEYKLKIEDHLDDASIEMMLIHKKIGNYLSKYNITIFHGSSVYIDDPKNGFIFTAPSSTGKSTHTRLLKELLKDRLSYINDDKPFISYDNNKFYLYGSMYNGKDRIGSNIKSNLKGIFVIKRAFYNKVTKLESNIGIDYLIKQIYIPDGVEESKNIYNLIFNLSKNIPIYLLECNMSIDAAKESFKVMESLIK